MDFSLSKVQAQLQDDARKLFDDKLSAEHIRELEQSESGFSQPIWDECVQRGWSGLLVSADFGGADQSLLDMCVLAEELGRGGAALPLVTSSGVAATILQNAPAGEQRDRCLSAIASGKIIAPALIDEQGRNEWDRIRLTLREDNHEGNGDYVMSGTKVFVPYASVADQLLVTAATSEGATALVLVDPAAEGVSISRHHTQTGIPVFSVTLSDVCVAESFIVHQGEDAHSNLMSGLNAGTLLRTAEAVGHCEALLQLSIQYVKVREAFGKPIGAFQAVAHTCADIHMNTEMVRILLHDAVWAVDHGRDALEEIHATKAMANELFAKTANDAFRVHGALGFSAEYDLEIFVRRLQGFFQVFGETEESFERAAQAVGI